MTSLQIIVAATPARSARAAALCDRLRDAWPRGAAPPFRTLELPALVDLDPEDVDALLLVSDGEVDQAQVLSVLGRFEESAVPVLAALDELPGPGNCYEFAGALAARIDEAPGVLAALLQGMVHRQRDVRRLRQETALARRFHGGLEGQITKIHDELQLAAMVQREFLPREVPAIHGIRVAALWRPSNYVSGDIYDVVRLDEDHLGLFIADAIGHGVPAALMTMIICRSLRTKEVDGADYRIVPPREVLARLNADMIRRQGRTTRFATAVYAVLDCRSRVMTMAGAGHPPPILLRHQGRTERLESSGGLLGVFDDERYDQIEVELHEGDQLLMYSDGFEQAFPDPPRGPGRSRLPSLRYLEEFQALRLAQTPLAMIQQLARRLDDQTGSLHQIDDVTFLCLVPGPKGAEEEARSAA